MKKLTHRVMTIILALSSRCFGSEIPVTVKPFYNTTVTTNQIKYVQNLAQKVISPDELNKVSISFSNRRHPGNDYYAIIHSPRIATTTHAIYRNIEVHNSSWPNRYFRTGHLDSNRVPRAINLPKTSPTELQSTEIDKPNPIPPNLWHYEQKLTISPLFRVDGNEYEISHSSNLSHDTITEIISAVLKKEAVLQCEVPIMVMWPIDPKKITWISFENEIYKIWTRSDSKSSHPNGAFYEAHLKDGKLIIIKIYNWIN